MRREDGIVGGSSGLRVPTLNGVWTEKVVLNETLVSELLDQIASSGLPTVSNCVPELLRR
jgi:hypothetical protein